jgi:hypothetical protein
LENGATIDKEYSQQICIVIGRLFKNEVLGGNYDCSIEEVFIGSLFEDSRDPVTGQTIYLPTLISNQSRYFNMFANPARILPAKDENNVFVSESRGVPVVGFTADESLKLINGAQIPAEIDKILAKISNVDDKQVDIVIEAGLGSIAEFCNENTDKNADGTIDADEMGTIYSPNYDVEEIIASVSTWRAVEDTLTRFCEKTRKDCMAILDAPRQLSLNGELKSIRKTAPQNTFANTIGANLRFITGIDSSYAALYTTWVKMLDATSGNIFWAPPSIKVASTYINVDINYEIWDAPAGLSRGQVTGINDISFNPNGKEADQLYMKQLNWIQKYPAEGFVIEGQKTTQVKPSAFDRVNVRRLFLRLERFARKTARYFVYEANNMYTRRRVVDVLTPMFERVKTAGGLYDFKIVCDESINPPSVVDANELKIMILLKPVRTAEFIQLSFFATRTDANFEEILGQAF